MKQDLFNKITEVTMSLNSGHSLHLHEPSFDQTEKDFLNKCIDSGFVSSVGAYVNEFESSIKEYTGAAGVVSCSNGTAALHLCLIAAGVQKEDEVLMPSLTFIATANACVYHNATPHFVDVCPNTLSVDPKNLRKYLEEQTLQKENKTINKTTGKKIAALIVMHCFGHIGAMDELQKVCDDFNIELIEDAAESLGSTYKGKHAGNLAKFAAISFNGNKIITTGGGGVFLTQSTEVAKKIKHISTTAKVPHPFKFIHDQVGYNYRMPNLNAALGMAQLQKLPKYLEKKRLLASKYQEAFKDCDYAQFMSEPDNCKSNYWLNFIKFNADVKLDEVITSLHEQKVFARPIWTPLHKLKPYENCPSALLDETLRLEGQILCLPSSPFLAG